MFSIVKVSGWNSRVCKVPFIRFATLTQSCLIKKIIWTLIYDTCSRQCRLDRICRWYLLVQNVKGNSSSKFSFGLNNNLCNILSLFNYSQNFNSNSLFPKILQLKTACIPFNISFLKRCIISCNIFSKAPGNLYGRIISKGKCLMATL